MSELDLSMHDWAYSIQKRSEEEISGKIVEFDEGKGNLVSQLHDVKVKELLKSLGLESNLPTKEELKNMKITPLDDPMVRKTYDPIFNEILDECSLADETFCRDEYKLYTIPSGEIAAIIVSNTWDGKYNIFIDREISIFNLMISKIVAYCFSDALLDMDKKRFLNNSIFENIDFCDRRALNRAKSDPVLKQICENLFSRATYVGYAGASRPWVPQSSKVVLFSTNLIDGMSKFVLAHEVAHGLCGHLTSDSLSKVTSGPFRDEDTFIMSHNDEYQADYHALLLTIESMVRKGYSPERAISGAYIFLKSIDILCNCYAIVNAPIEGTLSTHPRAVDRAEKIKKASLKLYKNTKNQKKIARCLKGIDSIFFWLNKHATMDVKNDKEAGILPREKNLVSKTSLNKPSILGILPDKRNTDITSKLERSILEHSSH